MSFATDVWLAEDLILCQALQTPAEEAKDFSGLTRKKL